MRPSFLVGIAAAALAAGPVKAQEAEPVTWQLGGLRSSFCIQVLLDPASEALGDLPKGYQPVRAASAPDLHLSLRSVIEAQPEFAGWAPSRLCFTAVDTIRTRDFTLADRGGKHPQLLAVWTVAAAEPSGAPQDVVLDLFASSDRLARSARLAGQTVHEARLSIGKVPAENSEGVRSSDERFQVKLRKTTITWDGRLAGESAPVQSPLRAAWTVSGERGTASGAMELSPAYSQAMAGSLKVDGKDAFAKALRASPTRFAGPSYRGGGGKVVFSR